MTRINRQDTLLTELREIKRRLRLLEAGRMRPAAALAPEPPPVPAIPVPPARPVDWPATESSEWERLATLPVLLAERGAAVELSLAADPGSGGEARVLVDGQPVGEPVPVTETLTTSTISVGAGTEISVEARRTEGTGLIRVTALLRA